jgi:hypothetical protein
METAATKGVFPAEIGVVHLHVALQAPRRVALDSFPFRSSNWASLMPF